MTPLASEELPPQNISPPPLPYSDLNTSVIPTSETLLLADSSSDTSSEKDSASDIAPASPSESSSHSPALIDTEMPSTETEPTPRASVSLPSSATQPSTADLTPTTSPIQELGRGLRTKNIPAKLQDYVLQTILPVVSRPSEAPFSLEFYVDCSRFSENHCQFLVAISSLKEPTSYRQAILDEIWRNSIQDEYTALVDNGTWIVVDLPPDKHALSCKWVFKYKFQADGTLERPK